MLFIGAGASKFLRVQRIFAQIFPKTCRATFTDRCCDLLKMVFICFSANVGLHFLKSNNVGRHFGPYFQGFCPDFQQIKTFGGALASPPPTRLMLLHSLST